MKKFTEIAMLVASLALAYGMCASVAMKYYGA